MQKHIHRDLYRILRKMGAKRNEIELNEKLTDLICFDDQEWLCFYFFIESRFNISLTSLEEKSMQTVANTITLIEKKLDLTPISKYTTNYNKFSKVG